MRSENMRLNHERSKMMEQIKDNTEKIKNNKQLPYLVGNVVEVRLLPPPPPLLPPNAHPQILNIDPDEDESNEGGNVDLDAQRKGKCAVIKTSTRQTIFLPLIGLVAPEQLKPGDLIGVNKDSYLVLDTLPAEYDSRVKAMEVDEKPTETYTDIGGLDKQIEELVEAIVLPMKQAEKFKSLGIKAPKGALMYGPPGAFFPCSAAVAGADTVLQEREKPSSHELAPLNLVPRSSSSPVLRSCRCSSETAPSSCGTRSSSRARRLRRSSLSTSSTRLAPSGSTATRVEIARCSGRCSNCSTSSMGSGVTIGSRCVLLSLWRENEADGGAQVIAATNRIDILDPALLRSGRLDRKIEFPLPTEEARARIME